MGSYIPLSANCKERDISIIVDLVYIIGAIIAAGVVVAMLTKF